MEWLVVASAHARWLPRGSISSLPGYCRAACRAGSSGTPAKECRIIQGDSKRPPYASSRAAPYRGPVRLALPTGQNNNAADGSQAEKSPRARDHDGPQSCCLPEHSTGVVSPVACVAIDRNDMVSFTCWHDFLPRGGTRVRDRLSGLLWSERQLKMNPP